MEYFNKPKTSSLLRVVEVLSSADVSAVRRISSGELLAGQRLLVIEHNGEEYRLQPTSKGKLILVK